MDIGTRSIGRDEPLYFIAEAGVNHNGELSMAKELVEVAADCGADAVKFQSFNTDELTTESAPKAEYQEETTGEVSQSEMLRRYELDRADHAELQNHCERHGITFLSTPFDEGSADLLDELGVDAFKIGSGELDNLPLLEHVAAFGTPMIVSTGMGTMAEVERAYERIRSVRGTDELALLHCASAYPAPMDIVNLAAIATLAGAFDVPVGYSDHTTAVETPALAVAAGAAIVEKHLTLDSSLPGPDHEASMEPAELDRAISLARTARVARGDGEKRPMPVERDNRDVIRKSLHAASSLEAGSVLSRSDISISRPADGLAPTELGSVVGRELRTGVTVDEPITADVLRGSR